MSELARRINDELGHANARGRLPELPQSYEDLIGRNWVRLDDTRFPLPIEDAFRSWDVSRAVCISKTLFVQGADPKEAQRLAEFFSHHCLLASQSKWIGKPWQPSERQAQELSEEAERLFQIACLRAASGNHGAVAAVLRHGLDLVGPMGDRIGGNDIQAGAESVYEARDAFWCLLERICATDGARDERIGLFGL